MSYAIIRNAKYKRENLKGIFRHNERRNKNYSNKNIDKELSYLNYSIKECKHTYEKEFDLIKEKEYFVITTNVDDQFYKTGFDKNKIFRVQGSYALNQCKYACHNKLYSNKELVEKMLENIDDNLKVPTKLVPICPVCGENMEPNLRKDAYFIQDDLWYKQSEAYENFIDNSKHKNLLLLEFGVGFNTPGIIRFPFEKMTFENKNWKLIRFNKEVMCFCELDDRFIGIDKDINEFFKV